MRQVVPDPGGAWHCLLAVAGGAKFIRLTAEVNESIAIGVAMFDSGPELRLEFGLEAGDDLAVRRGAASHFSRLLGQGIGPSPRSE